MKPSVLLIHTLGNRDLQFRREAALPVSFARHHLTENTETGAEEFLVIKKSPSRPTDRQFRKIIANLREQYAHSPQKMAYRRAMCFPMLEQAIDYVIQKSGRLDRLLLCATHQLPAHPQDTDELAELCQLYLKDHDCPAKETQLAFMDVNPTQSGRNRMVEKAYQLLAQQKAAGFNQIYLSNRQGIPDMSKAFDFAGLYQGYTYLSVHSKEGVSLVDHSTYEKVLADLVRTRLTQIL